MPKLPEGAIGRFAVVKLWPEIKTAEDECVARLKIAAKALGIECVEINPDGSFRDRPESRVSKSNVDFVIHLHYDTPKRYDAFSFVALWNPLKFYHEWGYLRCSRNLTTHDDFISCSSDSADHHVARMIRKNHTHLPAHFRLYHSVADVVHPPGLGAGKLFYAGINWEALGGGSSRHQEVLKRLDKTGLLRIYGPSLFQDVKVWAGYDSYVKEVPFDGVSMIEEISKAGIALVLSSPAHRASGLMSNRLFESVAAGALVICDENPFGKKHFGDSLLYIDSRSSVDQLLSDITGHLEWAHAHPDQALDMVARAQEVFRRKFTLIGNLSDLYSGLAERKRLLLNRQNPPDGPRVHIRLNLLMPEYSDAVLRDHIESVRVQEYRDFSAVLVVDAQEMATLRHKLEAAIAGASLSIQLLEVDFFDYGIRPEIKARRRLGEVVLQLLEFEGHADAFMVVAPNEKLFSNHLGVLAGVLQRDPMANCAATAAVLLDGESSLHGIHECIDFGHVDRNGPPGYGRFIFRVSAIDESIATALPYLDGRPLAVLRANNPIHQELPASIQIDVTQEFPERTWDEVAENHVIRDYSPGAFAVATGFASTSRKVAPLGQLSKGQFVRLLFRPGWVMTQLREIRTHGLLARLRVLKQVLSL